MRRIVLPVLALTLVLASAAAARAQVASGDAWQVTIAPYFMGASLNGATTVKGFEVTVDVSMSDIFDHLQFGAMSLVVARKGSWGVGGDAIWMSLGADGTGPGPIGVSPSVDFNQGAFAFYGLRRLGAAADLTFGGRVNTLQGSVHVSGPLGVHDADQTVTWFDPLVGVILHTPDRGQRWHAQVYTEIGGFAAGSDFTWQVFPTVGVNLAAHASIEFGYRWLDLDYTSGENETRFKYDVLTQGPVIGLAFRF